MRVARNPCPPPTATIPPATSANTAACALATPTSRANCVSPNGGPSCEKKGVTFCEQGGFTYCENGGSCKVGGGCDCDEGFIGNTCGEIDREWMKQRHGGSSGASKKEVINVAAAVAVPLCLVIAAGSGFMCFMVRRERKGAPLFMKLDDSPAPPPVPDLEMSAQNALPGPPAPPPKA